MLTKLLLIKLCTQPVHSYTKCNMVTGSQSILSTIYSIGATFDSGNKCLVANIGGNLVLTNSCCYKRLRSKPKVHLKRRSVPNILVAVCTLDVSNALTDMERVINSSGYDEVDVVNIIEVAHNLGIKRGLSSKDASVIIKRYGNNVIRRLPIPRSEYE